MAIMKPRKDAQTNILGMIRNNPYDQRYALLVAKFHHFPNLGSTVDIHRVQAAQIAQEPEATG